MHARDARKAGETDERLFAVAAWREAPYFTDAERAALALAEAVARLNDRADAVPEEVWNEAPVSRPPCRGRPLPARICLPEGLGLSPGRGAPRHGRLRFGFGLFLGDRAAGDGGDAVL